MAVPFTFGQALLQGLEQGQGIRQQRDELAFRRDAQQAAQTLAEDQFEASKGQFDRAQKQREFEFGVTSSFDAQNLGFQNRQTNLAEEAQRQTFSRFVDLQTPDGQTAQIDIRDLLGDQREQDRISLQRRALNAQYQPFTITDDQRLALGNLLSGQHIPGGSVTLPYQLADPARAALSAGIDPVAQSQRQNYLGALSAGKQFEDFIGQATQASTVDPSRIAPEIGRFDELRVRANNAVGILAPFAGGPRERLAAQGNLPTTTGEFNRVIDEQEGLARAVGSLPMSVRGEASAILAERSVSILGDAASKLEGANVPASEKRDLMNRLVSLSRFQASNLPQGNPLVDNLNLAINRAMEDEEYELVAKLSAQLVNISKAASQSATSENRARLQEIEFQTGGN
jgi:hypothetical protein